MKKIILSLSVLLSLMGCGGRAPFKRAENVLFDVPYIQQTKTYESLSLGVKKLSTPEIRELFCKANQLLKTYHVYYVRVHNTGTENYFMHISGQSLPTRKEISVFFDPYTILHTIAHILFVVPAGIGLATLAPDALTYFAGFLGINVGLHLAETQALGVNGYQEFEKHVIAGDAERRMSSVAVVPYALDHYLVFVQQRDPRALQLTFTVSARNKMTQEITFDFVE